MSFRPVHPIFACNHNQLERAEMKNRYTIAREDLARCPQRWLITGVAGFIGSNLLEALLKLDQQVVGLDNFSTGSHSNLEEVSSSVGSERWARFELIEGDIRNASDCARATQGIDHVSHQAALGSVPRSLLDPVATNDVNIGGFLNMLIAARDEEVTSFTYAASSSTYGDHPGLPKVENLIGKPLSPYAVTKYVNELYADVFARSYGFNTVGLRYFNVFGKRQDPNGAYAAVIPRWIAALMRGEGIQINGDGKTSRDFCHVENVVQANILAATAANNAKNEVYNVAVGGRTTLNQLLEILAEQLRNRKIANGSLIRHGEFRAGDVLHSQASIEKICRLLGYSDPIRVQEGLAIALNWYVDRFEREIG